MKADYLDFGIFLCLGLVVASAGVGGAAVPDRIGAVQAQTQAGSGFTVADFRGPTQANSGQTVTATATIRNVGSSSDTTEIQYRIGGQVIARTTVTVSQGEAITVSLRGTIPTLATGTYTHGVFVGSSGTGQTASLLIGTASMQLAVLSFEGPSLTRPGEEISATATIQNTGQATASETFQYRIGNLVIATRDVSLRGGEQTQVRFSGTVPAINSGRYLQGVFEGPTDNGLTRGIIVTASTASFSVTSLQAPARSQVGESITATVTVRNTGTDRGSVTLGYRVDGTTIATRSVSLDGGARTTVSLQGAVPERPSGSYIQGVFIGETTSGLTANLRVFTSPSAYFRISELSAPTNAERGERIRVTARLTNDGADRAEVPVEYRIGSTVVSTQRINLRPGHSTTVIFDVTVPDLDRGAYTHGVYVGNTPRGQASVLQITRQARVAVSNFIGPPTVRVGDRVTVSATVINRETTRVTERVEYRIGEHVVGETRASLGAGEQRTISITGTVPDLAPGTYRQGVFADSEGPTTGINVTAGEAPRSRLTVSDLRGPARASPGDEISVQVTLTNVGRNPTEQEIQYRLGREVLDSETVELIAGQRQTLTFEVTVPELDDGTYRHGVFLGESETGQTSSIVIGPPEPSAEPTPTETAERTESPGLDGFGFAISLLTLVVILAFVIQRRD